MYGNTENRESRGIPTGTRESMGKLKIEKVRENFKWGMYGKTENRESMGKL